MKEKAKIKCGTYGGNLGWFLRTHFSKYTSWAYLNATYLLRKPLFKRYIRAFYEQQDKGAYFLPCIVSIETINRCNNDCGFCPVNRLLDTRPFARMEEWLFEKIINELANLGYAGYLNLYVNNEPFVDTRIEDWYKYAKEKLPKAKMLLYTNGLLLNEERFHKIIPYIDKMIINNYSKTLRLHHQVENIYNLVKTTPKYWSKDITIQIRYSQEILTNRGGGAPNKKYKVKNSKICVMPFTDLTVYPDGTVGLCCNDALEKTNYGNLKKQSIYEIWTNAEYHYLRETIGNDRSKYKFCDGCDFVDAGIRDSCMNDVLARI